MNFPGNKESILESKH